MRYMGGKGRIAKQVAEVILANRAGRPHYLEPFLGGAYVFAYAAPHFERALGSDVTPDLILFWQAVQRGWLPPERITREEYARLRTAEPSALRAFAGFGCSFGGKWFDGYGAETIDAKHPFGHVSVGSRDSTIRKAPALRGVRIELADYRRWAPGPDAVAYCDPPYAGTTGYDANGTWDAAEFWIVAEKWARGGTAVLVSEYGAPDGWESVWSASTPRSLRKDSNSQTTTEHLFMLRDRS
jgi:DNA adenine methylase